MALYNGASRAAGAVFPNGSRSVLYFGQLGVGQFCYGQATSDPTLAGKTYEPGVYCYDPTSGSKGSTAYPYKFLVWAYDANDLAAVRSGTKQDWEVVPYATWELSLPIVYPIGPAAHINIGSVATIRFLSASSSLSNASMARALRSSTCSEYRAERLPAGSAAKPSLFSATSKEGEQPHLLG